MRGQTNASNIGGNVGDDTHPIKIVGSVPTPVTTDLVPNTLITGGVQTGQEYASGGIAWAKFGRVVMVMISALATNTTGYNQQVVASGIPIAATDGRGVVCDGAGANTSLIQIPAGSSQMFINNPSAAGSFFGTIYYLT